MARTLYGIVAVCPDLGIGKNGNLPWHPVRLSNEFKHFRKMTSTPSMPGKKNVVIMGRKTWFSIPEKNRPLNDRINIVLSRECKTPPAGAHHLAPDFSSALRLVDTELADQADKVWVIGGSSIYKELMEYPGTKRLFVTRIQKQFDCDTFLPEISLDNYRLLSEKHFRRHQRFPFVSVKGPEDRRCEALLFLLYSDSDLSTCGLNSFHTTE
ncbi:dihydrofolate reductase isoform X3 [Mastacembelus armatus]|uniref:dihydrofolate reductase isoform X3 n=1 Tax=Mastacembelus armatus TaxID=205130 RepID=UPI000E454F23|nr:dihydrofolate reductase isoform X3 [Mastacembelus armatus]